MFDLQTALAYLRDRLRALGLLLRSRAHRRRTVEHLARRLGWSRSQAKPLARWIL